MITFDIGDQIRIGGSFTNTSNVATDPTAVKFVLKNPDGVETIYVYGTDAQIVRDGVGEYHFDLVLTANGPWHWRWRATGDVTAASKGFVKVVDTGFVNSLP